MRYGLRFLVPPSVEPIHLAEAKLFLRVDHVDEDSLIEGLIRRARQRCESWLEAQLIDATWELKLDEFPSETSPSSRLSSLEQLSIVVPRVPLVSVSSISYVDSNGATQTLAASVYQVAPHRLPGLIGQAFNQFWPVARLQLDAVTVTFLAGYATPLTANAATDVLTATGRSFSNGDRVTLTNSGGLLPAGLNGETTYYVVSTTGSTFKLSMSSGGPAVDITDAGSGTTFAGQVPGSVRQAMLNLIAGWYEHRGDDVPNEGFEMAVQNQLWLEWSG